MQGGISITQEGADLVFASPFNRRGVDDLKDRIPFTDRAWDGRNKVWRVHPRHAQTLVDLAWRWWGEQVQAPTVSAQPVEEIRLFDVRYVGCAREREAGKERTAYAWVDGTWGVIFTEEVLRRWFLDATPAAGAANPQAAKTLYAVLMLPEDAPQEDIRKNYRKLARQWHPDVCTEPNAADMFVLIQQAYETLSDPKRRKKYDAGLRLQAMAEKQIVDMHGHRARSAYKPDPQEYRSPLRCGLVMVKGSMQVGKFFVTEILGWEDLVNDQGQTLVTSWPMGADAPVEVWS